MIRMRIFEIDRQWCDNGIMDGLKNHDPIAYKDKIKQRDEAFAPIEDFIAEVGFENIRKITTAGVRYDTICVFFYEDGMPYVSRAKAQPLPLPPMPKQRWFDR